MPATTDLTLTFRRGSPDDIVARLNDGHPADVATVLQPLQPQRRWEILKDVSPDRQADVLCYLNPRSRAAMIQVIPQKDLAAILAEMDPDDRADVYHELPAGLREAVMPALAQAEREDVRRLASFKEGTAGAIMTSAYAALSPELDAADALTMLRHEAPAKETIDPAYVIDADRRLLGSVRLRDLITAPPGGTVSDLMDRNTHAVAIDEDIENAARLIARYDIVALPVIDSEGRLAGIITHDDALDVMEAEATEDFHKVGTVGKIGSSVADATILMLYRARIGWLMLLVFGNIFSGAGIAHFEDTIAAHLALMFFLPILIASGGNAGSQSATLMVRALATGDIGPRDWTRVLGRELAVAVLLGVSMAAAIALIGVVRGGPQIALVISLSMILIVIVGSLIGMALPFILSRFDMDPATASTPLVTSIADATGVVIYFSIAQTILPLP
ncbi:magnesium transporter [Paracoccus luteus]|uniref:magnesium transporter n=1 Tax=Paracoccus luteus TaxID=2508543 RepID=UPI00106F6DA5|nr:magnesium transporter [Paracoccus luteus]